VKKRRKRRKIELKLKKQSQFLKGENGVNLIFTIVYGISVAESDEKTNPIKANFKTSKMHTKGAIKV